MSATIRSRSVGLLLPLPLSGSSVGLSITGLPVEPFEISDDESVVEAVDGGAEEDGIVLVAWGCRRRIGMVELGLVLTIWEKTQPMLN